MPKAIIKLELQACHGMSRKKLYHWLTSVARDCNRVKIAACRHWMRWREDNPDWTPGPRRKKDGSAKLDGTGNPVLEHPAISQDEVNAMYSHVRQHVPRLSSNIASKAVSKVVSDLKSRLPYDHEGDAKYVWEALLLHERAQPNYRSLSFPVPNQNCGIRYDGAQKLVSKNVDARIARYGGNSAVVRFGLWSRQAGHSKLDVICRVGMKRLSQGHRCLIKRIASGEWKLADSAVTKRKNKWYLDVCYEVPVKCHDLDRDRVATLDMGSKSGFRMIFPDGRVWKVGDDKPYVDEFERVALRRDAIRYRSRNQQGQGHGKKRFYQRLRPHSRRIINLQDEYRRQLVNDVVKACIKLNCGRVMYLEPTKPLREKSYFAECGVDFNWSLLLPMLQFKMECHSIEFESKRMGVKEWLDIHSTAKSAEKKCS